MQRASVIASMMLVGVTLAGAAIADSSTSPGKENFHVSIKAVAVPAGSEAVLLSGQIERGKRGRVLIVEAFVGSLAPGENGLFRPQVNGVFLEPTDDFGNGNAMGINCPTTTSFACSGGAHWWIDLDAAEAAHPGTFYNKPLNVDLLGRGATSLGVVANLSARLEKKK